MTTTLRDYVLDHPMYTYTGTVWGECAGPMSSEDVITCLNYLCVGDPKLIENPSVSGDPAARGYYTQAGELWCRFMSCHERILQPMD
jgi:hypothetical protein